MTPPFVFGHDYKNPKEGFNLLGLRVTTHQYGDKLLEVIVAVLGVWVKIYWRWGK